MTNDGLTVLWFAAAANILCGVAVWLKRRSSRANQYFALFAGAVALWTLSAGLSLEYAATPWGVAWARTAFASASLIPLLFLLFVRVFPSRVAATSRAGLVTFQASGLAATVVSFGPWIVQRTMIVDGVLKVSYGPLHAFFGAYFLLCLGYGLAVLARKLRVVRGIERLQVRYVFLGVASAGLGATITNLIVPVFVRSSRLSPYGPLFSILLIAVIAHAVVRYRLMEVRVVISRGVTYGLAAGASGALFVALLGLTARLVNPRPQALEFGLILLAGLCFQPLRRWLQTGVDRYFFREHYDYDRTIRDASRHIVSTLDLRALLQYVCRLIDSTVRPEVVAVYMTDRVRNRFQPVLVHGSSGGEEVEGGMPVDAPALAVLLSSGRPYVLGEGTGAPDGPDVDEVQQELRRLGGELAFPILEGGRLGGFFLVGPKRSADAYLRTDVELLATVTGQASIAIGNARLHRRILLVEAEKQRAERLAAVGAFASGVAHEIKNPLVAIRAFAELLPERYSDAEFRTEFSRVVVQEIDRISGMVGRLFALGRSARQQVTCIDLAETIDATLALVRASFEQARVHIEKVYGPGRKMVAGDGTRLKQLFLNVFMNALEAMPEGGHLAIRVADHRTLESRLIAVEITDTGGGIPEEVLDSLFEPFVSTKARGSGLGLSICRSIADSHHATVRARNNEGSRGATVTVEFRAAEESDVEGERVEDYASVIG